MPSVKDILAGLPADGLIVGAVMRETLGTTLAFVSWYLREGADRVVICFDDPDDPAIAVLQDHPSVVCLPCTVGFWRGVGVAASARFPKRQNRAMQFIYESLRGGWFLNVDGDELIYLKGRRLVTELADAPAEVRSVTILPAENVQAPGMEGVRVFRTPMSRDATQEVYGDHAGMMIRRQGLSGHTVGKTANRAGITGVIMRQHFLQQMDGTKIMDRIIGPEEGAYLLHFFDQGYDVWRAKLPWRLSSSGFTPRARGVLLPLLEGPDPEPKLRAVYEILHVFDAERRALLAQHGALLEVQLDVEALTARTFPKIEGTQTVAVRYTL
ncbi:MAG: glycosyltransferase family 2 protein [Sulfitobacter sp.]